MARAWGLGGAGGARKADGRQRGKLEQALCMVGNIHLNIITTSLLYLLVRTVSCTKKGGC